MLVLVIVGFAVMATQVDRMLEFVLDFSRERVEAGFPEDATEAERDRLRLAFDSVLEHYRSRQATAADNRRLQTALTDALRRLERGVFDRDDLQRLTERMERIGSPGPED